MARRNDNWLTRWSRRLTFGKLSVGRGRRARRSQRLKVYEATALFPASPTLSASLQGWVSNRLALLGTLLTAALLLYLAFGTTWFYIYDIELTGAERLSKEELYNRSNLEALSIFWLNPRQVAQRIEAEPMVAHASVSALPPNRVRVRIQERTPLAVWQAGDRSLFVDAEGMLFGLRGDASEMLVIHDLREEPVVPGGTVDPIAVHAAQALNRLLPERRAFDWEPGVGLSFVTEQEWRVVFGDHTRLPAKIAAFRAFQEQVEPEREILLLDLSVPEHPYYRFAP